MVSHCHVVFQVTGARSQGLWPAAAVSAPLYQRHALPSRCMLSAEHAIRWAMAGADAAAWPLQVLWSLCPLSALLATCTVRSIVDKAR
jgi:hypothetical protein